MEDNKEMCNDCNNTLDECECEARFTITDDDGFTVPIWMLS